GCDLALELLARWLRPAGQDDLRPLAGEQGRDGASDALRGARHQRHLAVEPHGGARILCRRSRARQGDWTARGPPPEDGTIRLKIGRPPDHPTPAGGLDYGRAAIELVLDEVNASGGIGGQQITMVDADGVGSVERVIAGARGLAAEGCLLILGPSVTDFAVPLIPVLDDIRVPSINWSGSGLARG